MKTRKLGSQGLVVTELGLGCMGMSQFYGPRDDAESTATLERAIELGLDFFDTADVYGTGHNEELVGKVLRKHRNRVIIATKFGNQVLSDGTRAINGRPEYVRSACDASLKRLGVGHVDLYYQHRVDKNVPIEETVGAMADLVRQGKVRYLGLSEASAKTIRRAHAVHPISALQSEYSLWTRDYEDEVIPTLRELGVGFVPFSPLGRGLLSGELKDLPADDMRKKISPRFEGGNLDQNLKGGRALEGDRPGKRYHAEPARARMGARAGRRYRSDPGHQTPQVPRRECRGGRCETVEERPRAYRGSRAQGFRRGRTLSRYEYGQYLSLIGC